jgi:hypothetical protein
MVTAVVIKQPDTQPLITVTVTEPTTDFSTVSSAQLVLIDHLGTTTTKSAVITSQTTGTLTATWRNDGTLAAGAFKAWLKLSWADGTSQHAPTAGSLGLTVEALA